MSIVVFAGDEVGGSRPGRRDDILGMLELGYAHSAPEQRLIQIVNVWGSAIKTNTHSVPYVFTLNSCRRERERGRGGGRGRKRGGERNRDKQADTQRGKETNRDRETDR